MNIFSIFASFIMTSCTNLYNEITVHTINEFSKVDHQINIKNESIHLIVVNQDSVLIKCIEDKEEKVVRKLIIKEKEETLYDIIQVLNGFPHIKPERSLIVCSYNEILDVYTLKDAFMNFYKQVITNYCIFNGPKKFSENNSIGIFINETLNIQYHKYDNNLLNIFMKPVDNDNFLHQRIYKFLVEDNRTLFPKIKVFADLFNSLPIYRFVINYLDNAKFGQRLFQNIIFFEDDYMSVKNNNLKRSVVTYSDRLEFLNNTSLFLIEGFREVPLKKFFKFLQIYKNIKDTSLFSCSFMYHFVRKDNELFKYLLTECLKENNLFHYDAVIISSYLLGLIDENIAAKFMRRNENLCFNDIEKCPGAKILRDKLMSHKFKENDSISDLFYLIIVDKLIRVVINEDREVIIRFKSLRHLVHLKISLPYTDDDTEYFTFVSNYKRLFDLYGRLFKLKEVIFDIKAKIIYDTLFKINYFVLQNTSFDLFKVDDYNYSADDDNLYGMSSE